MTMVINVFNKALPLMIFFTELYISVKSIYIIKNKLKIDIFKEITDFFFIIYIIYLFYIVTIPKFNYQISNFKLFNEILRYPIGSKLFIKNVLGNLFLFIPYSIYLSYRFKINKLYIIFILALLFSLTIELIQTKIGRVFDIDDIILNTGSGIIGYYIFKICNNKFK